MMDTPEQKTDEQIYQETVEKAAREFLDRKARRSHPKGGQKSCGKWWPDEDERCGWCASIREPSCAYPWSLMHHCRTAEHLADRMDVDPSDVRRRAREIVKREGR